MAKPQDSLTVRQQVWLAAWTAAIQSAKYNPNEEATSCLEAFDRQFGNGIPEHKEKTIVEKNIVFKTE